MSPEMHTQIAEDVFRNAVKAAERRRDAQSITDHACLALQFAVSGMEEAAKTERRQAEREALINTAWAIESRLMKLRKSLEGR